MEKQDYLNEIALMDAAVIEKLYLYAQLIIIPEEDLLLNVNMQQMVDKGHELADSFFPEWTDRNKTDFGEFLLELICLFSEKDFWYINAFANESILNNTAVYSDAFVKATNYGYRPVLCRGSSGTFDVTFAAGDPITYGIGDLVLVQDFTGLEYTNELPIVLDASVTVTLVPLQLFEGKYALENSNFNGHSIVLTKQLIDINSIVLEVFNVTWRRVDLFGQSSSGDKHFVVVPEEDGRATIYFGEDGYGLKPNVGDACRIRYRTTTGSAGNGIVRTVAVGKYQSARPAMYAAQTTPSIDGTLPETLAQIKNNAPLYKSTKGACYNEYSTQKFLNGLNYIKQSKVEILGNKVYFYVIPTNGIAADAPLLDTIKTTMEPYLMNGYFANPQPTTYVSVEPLNITVSFLNGYNTVNGVSLIRQLIEDYTNPLVLAKYDQSFNLTDLSLLLRSKVPGLQNVIYNTVAGTTPANVVVPPNRILKKIDQSNLTVNATIIV